MPVWGCLRRLLWVTIPVSLLLVAPSLPLLRNCPLQTIPTLVIFKYLPYDDCCGKLQLDFANQ